MMSAPAPPGAASLISAARFIAPRRLAASRQQPLVRQQRSASLLRRPAAPQAVRSSAANGGSRSNGGNMRPNKPAPEAQQAAEAAATQEDLQEAPPKPSKRAESVVSLLETIAVERVLPLPLRRAAPPVAHLAERCATEIDYGHVVLIYQTSWDEAWVRMRPSWRLAHFIRCCVLCCAAAKNIMSAEVGLAAPAALLAPPLRCANRLARRASSPLQVHLREAGADGQSEEWSKVRRSFSLRSPAAASIRAAASQLAEAGARRGAFCSVHERRPPAVAICRFVPKTS